MFCFAARNVVSTGSPGITLNTDQVARFKCAADGVCLLHGRGSTDRLRRLGAGGPLGASDASAIGRLPGLVGVQLVGGMDLFLGQQRFLIRQDHGC